MNIVGKTAIIQPQTKKLVRFYLSNGSTTYRCCMWEDKIFNKGAGEGELTTEFSSDFYKMKLGNVRF